MRRAVWAVGATVMALAMGNVAIGGDDKKDQDAMQGDWSVSSFKDSSAKGGSDLSGDILKTFDVTIKGDVLKATIKDLVVLHVKLKLDPSKTPKTVDFTHIDQTDKGKIETGIYKLDGDTLVFCFTEEKERPTAFSTKDGSKIAVVTLQKKKKK